MHDTHFLSQVVILFGTAVFVAWLFRVLSAPAIIGFLFTGILIGPSTFGWIDRDSVDQFAEIGLILLLFTVGLELSPAPLMRAGKQLIFAMMLQVTATGVIAGLVGAVVLGASPIASAMLGIAVSLSSTAIALKQLSDRGEIQTTMGNIITGILLLQDVFVILVMLVLPLLGAASDHAHSQTPMQAALAFVGAVAVVAGARYALPWVLRQLLSRGGQELTTLFAVMMAGGGAWLAALVGWSPALGACIAGFLLARADIRHQLVADITPFRDVFNALFFIAMGMLVDTSQVMGNLPGLAAAVVVTLVLKTLITFGAVRAMGWSSRIAIQVGIGLCTVSEFGYVLLHQAHYAGLVSEAFLGGAVAYIVGTMMIGAYLFPWGVKFGGSASVLFKEDIELTRDVAEESEEELSGHVVVVGYGVNGQNLATVLKNTHIPFCVVEMNHGLVRLARSHGAPVVVGDATRFSILHHAGIERARALVVGINDIQATRRIVSISRAACPDLHIVVRTQYVAELEELTKRGADVVVPAEYEASVKIFSHVLEELDVPRNILGAQVAAVRAGGYGVFRGKSTGSSESLEDLLKVLQLAATQTYFVPESSSACGRTLQELDLRRQTGATVIAIVRDRVPHTPPPPDMTIEANDVLVLVGSHVQLAAARKQLEAVSHLGSSQPLAGMPLLGLDEQNDAPDESAAP